MPERQEIRCASYLILVKDGDVLLMERQNTGFRDGMYSLVAGHVDQGENYTEAMIREAREEIGIELDEGELETVHVMHRDSDESAYVDVYFRAENWEGEVKNMEPEKCSGLKWIDPENPPENTIGYVKEVIQQSKGEHYSEYGWSQ